MKTQGYIEPISSADNTESCVKWKYTAGSRKKWASITAGEPHLTG